jgi:hypothetical protein
MTFSTFSDLFRPFHPLFSMKTTFKPLISKQLDKTFSKAGQPA